MLYIRLHSSFFGENFKREKLGKSNEVTLGLRIFGERLSWAEETLVNTLVVRSH